MIDISLFRCIIKMFGPSEFTLQVQISFQRKHRFDEFTVCERGSAVRRSLCFFVLSDLIITYSSRLFNNFLDFITIIANEANFSRKVIPNSESGIDTH